MSKSSKQYNRFIENPTEAGMMSYQQLNDTNVPYPVKKTVDQLFTETAVSFPQSTAIIFEKEKITYQELEAQANQFAHYLIEKGIKKNDVFGLALERSVYLPIFIFGILKAGATFQPLDPDYPAQRIDYILQDGAARLLITSMQNQYGFHQSLSIVFLEDIIRSLKSYSTATPEIKKNSHDLIYILHTSGSTGKPKGVLIEHRNMVNLLTSMQKAPGLQQTDKLLSITSISFDIFYLELFLPLITGATMVMMSSSNSKDARAVIDCVRNEKITFLQSTPAFWNIIEELCGNQPLPLKAVSGGEPLSKELAKRLLGKVKELWNGYGPTEATVYASMKNVTENDEIITIGKPINNTQFYFFDGQMQLVKPGEIGEIFIAGENVGRGYSNLPEMTLERFLVDSVTSIPNKRMYQTGDMGRLLKNGEVQCLGRIDQQIKINGFRIELGEIEHTISLVNPFVKQVVINPFIDKNNVSHLVAYYSCKSDADILPGKAWKKLLKAYLPNYMVPDYYVLIDVFQLTPNGKIDRDKLRLPENNRPVPINGTIVTPTENIIKKIWEDALGGDMAGLDDDFFEVGGHSLIAAQLMQQIEKATGKWLPLTTLFENATIRTLSAVVDNQKENKLYKSLVPINTSGTKVPLFVVHGSGLNILMFYPLSKYLDNDQPLYGLQALGLDGSAIEGNTIEELAKLYNDELLEAVQGDKFAILGYSLGGIIALEMAKQLKAIGKKVTFLGIIDTHINNDYHVSSISRILKKVFRQPKKLAFVFSTLWRYPQKTIRYQLFILTFKLTDIFKQLMPKAKADIPLESTINKHYGEAYVNYKLTPYDDGIFLFKVQERIYYIDDGKNLGWSPYSPKGLTVHTVPGDHKTFLLPPNDKIFADKLQEILNCLH